MIKKFNEFIKEGEFDEDAEDYLFGDNDSLIYSILSVEDIEDQFLRLKEVLGCSISILDPDDYDDCENAYVKVYSGSEWGNKSEVEKELNQIKYRMENMYPVVVKIKYDADENDWGDMLDEYFIAKISPKDVDHCDEEEG